ncbi:S8 family peptidase [Actinoplanes sp. GCM10030250]|uniref:S8 family peptidase n=1 Tax=Actinoplanes sp. GCM10030250 TaxID=3273376 RepID=UPI00360A1ACB
MSGTAARRLALRFAAVASAVTAAFALSGPAYAVVPAAPLTGTITGAGADGAIPGNYVVVLEPGPSTADRVPSASQELVREYGGTVAATYQSTVSGFHLQATAAQAARLAADPAVRYVEQDVTITTTATTQGETAPWGLDRIDQPALPLSRSYTAPSAAAVTAYVIDTGIRVSHQEFGGRAVDGWDFVDGDGVADDCHGHGTHVAGTIGGATAGVAKDVRLVALKVLNCEGYGSYTDFIAAIDWVTANAKLPAVVNMSLGGPAWRALDEAVERSIATGVTYAIAAGNDNTDACGYSPAATEAAITVGATDSTDARASFSNWGTCVDLFAPGVAIESAGHTTDTATRSMSGTSMAAPHVTGAAALVLGAHPGWTPRQVRDHLVEHAGTALIRDAGAGSPDRLLYTGHLNTAA